MPPIEPTAVPSQVMTPSAFIVALPPASARLPFTVAFDLVPLPVGSRPLLPGPAARTAAGANDPDQHHRPCRQPAGDAESSAPADRWITEWECTPTGHVILRSPIWSFDHSSLRMAYKSGPRRGLARASYAGRLPDSTRANLSIHICNCTATHQFRMRDLSPSSGARRQRRGHGTANWYAPQRNEARPADQLVHLAWGHGRRSARPSAESSARPTTSASIRSGSWTTSSRSGASDRSRSRCSKAGRRSGSWPRIDQARPPRPDGRRRPLPEPGAVGQGRDDPRRPVGRPGLARHRGRLERGRVAGARFPVPAARRAVRDARGDAPDRPRHVGGRARQPRRSSTGGRSMPSRLLNSPQSLSRPRVPIMIGGGGEKKTLRLVAQYADATNVFGTPEGVARKYAILAEHCAAIGRDPDEIERSTLQNIRSRATARGGTETPGPGRRPLRRLLRRRRPARHRQHAPAPRSRRARARRPRGHPAPPGPRDVRRAYPLGVWMRATMPI